MKKAKSIILNFILVAALVLNGTATFAVDDSEGMRAERISRSTAYNQSAFDVEKEQGAETLNELSMEDGAQGEAIPAEEGFDGAFDASADAEISTMSAEDSSALDDDAEEDDTWALVEAMAAAEELATDPVELGYEPGQIIVAYDSDVPDEVIDEHIQENAGEITEVITSDTETVTGVIIPEDITVETAVEQFADDPNVLYAQPNYIYTLGDEPGSVYSDDYAAEDEEKMTQESEEEEEDGTYEAFSISSPTDTYYSKQWYLNSIKAINAWTALKDMPHQKVRVAVLDTGCKMDHKDLKGIINTSLSIEIRYDASSGKYPTNALKGDGMYEGNPVNYNDGTSSAKVTHGTGVCGLVAARADNSYGIAGVGSGGDNSVVDLIAVDIYNSRTVWNSTSTLCVKKGMEYAKEKGCKVVNLSLGMQKATDNTLKRACQDLYDNGITVVASAGNSNTTSTVLPCDFDTTIGVISTDKGNTKSSFSNYGAAKDISAPGGSVWSTSNASTTYDGLQSMSGTSFAAPVVSGVVAMLYSVNPNLTAAQVKSILTSTAIDLGAPGKDNVFGYGLINAYEALNKAYQNYLSTLNYTATAVATKVSDTKYKITATADKAVSGTIKIAVWSATGGQDDIAWYDCTPSADKKTFTYTVDASKFSHLGTFNVHVYFGTSKKLCSITFTIPEPSGGSATTSNVNVSGGTFKAAVAGISNAGSVSKVQFAVWSTSNQSDIKWYDATKNSDGSYSATINLNNHNYNVGTYQIHAYAETAAGEKKILSKTTQAMNASGTTSVKANADGITFVISTSGLVVPGGYQKVSYEVWSNVSGKDDVLWYSATSPKYTVNVSKHSGTGVYYVNCYGVNKKGTNVLIDQATFNVSATATQAQQEEKEHQQTQTTQLVPIYRLYNMRNGEHLYTSDVNEKNVLAGLANWKYEGIGWQAPKSGKAIYRLFNPKSGWHLYTSDQNEINALTTKYGWKKDNNGKPLFYSGGSVPVYRLYNKKSGDHHLTTDVNEYKALPKYGWVQEGISLYAEKIK